MLDIPLWFALSLGCCAAVGAGFGASHWASARRIATLGESLDKADKARQLALVQNAQTRRQIERLHAELSAQQRDMAERLRETQQRVHHLQQLLALGEKPAGLKPEVSVHGFADTEPMATVTKA